MTKIQFATATDAEIKLLHGELLCGMMDCAEVFPLDSDAVADGVMHVERTTAVRFTMQQIARTWMRAADDMVDSYIENANVTPQSDAERQEQVARYAAMRPTAQRRTAILKALKDAAAAN